MHKDILQRRENALLYGFQHTAYKVYLSQWSHLDKSVQKPGIIYGEIEN